MTLFAVAAAESGTGNQVFHYGRYGIYAIAVAVLLWVGQRFFGALIDRVGSKSADSVLTGIFGGGRFGVSRLRKYRRAVQKNFASHALGFGGTDAINIRSVYVPLRYETPGGREDVYARIREENRSVVVGPAGAGKSLLLKNSMLIWADGSHTRSGHRNDRRVPVLVELHRCNASDADIPQLVLDELARNQVKRARSFVEKALREGRLRLLLDGLDEIGRDRHEHVIRMIKDFATANPDCQIVVTCRDAVYHGQLSPEFAHVVRIADFDDASLRRFLGKWPGMERRDVNSLTYTLRSNPSLMHLARSPLLLTMIAYLYVNKFAKTGRSLPGSRVTFYETAITHLLGRDRELGRAESLSAYDVGDKLSVLQRIALTLQQSKTGIADRKEISYTRAIAVTQDVLPDINLDSTHAKLLLAEIVDRSQLLISLNQSRTQYAFRHLTLQEFLAARELADEPDVLLDCYRSDPDGWREVVKLWCGGTRNCTSVVREVMQFGEPRHQVLALECLAEAKYIDDTFAHEVIARFMPLLGAPGVEGRAAVSAFGALAAAEGPRGKSVLTDLTRLAAEQDWFDTGTRRAAFLALSASGRQEAAQALAPMAAADDAARAALRAMGELAIPVLEQRARLGYVDAVDDLGSIGTPDAAEALTRLLDAPTAGVQTAKPQQPRDRAIITSAWWLAELLRNPDVEEGLQNSEFQGPPTVGIYDWIWRPFARSGTREGPMGWIAGRIAYLIDINPKFTPEFTGEVDPRIAVPIAGLALGNRLKRGGWALRDSLRDDPLTADGEDHLIAEARATAPSDDTGVRICAAVLKKLELEPAYDALIARLPWPVRARLMAAVFTDRIDGVDQRDWLEVNRDANSAEPLWWAFGILVVTGIVGSIIFASYWQIETIRGASHFGPSWASWIALPALVVGVVLFFVGLDDENTLFFTGILAVLAMLVLDVLESGWVLSTWVGWTIIVPVFAAAICGAWLLGWLAERRDRRHGNPLRHCMLAGGRSFADRTSVIAK